MIIYAFLLTFILGAVAGIGVFLFFVLRSIDRDDKKFYAMTSPSHEEVENLNPITVHPSQP